jgi:carboxylesterase type B
LFIILTNASSSCSSTQDTLECLRGVDVNSLQSANADINNSGFYGTAIFVPVVDGSFITKRPTEVLKAGKVNGVR